VPVTATDSQGNSTNKSILLTVTGGPNRTLTYDSNGNLTNNGAGQSYQWDAENRLVSVTQATGVTGFVYDGLGHRLQETFGGSVIKQWVWCGDQPCEERDANGNVTKRFYVQGEQIGGVPYYFTRDHLGSVREMVDANGTIRARYDYDPFGRMTKISGDLSADFGFAGNLYHQATNLNLTLFRAYDPNLGRWLSRDPIGENGGLNLYGYVGNNPVNLLDPLGLCDCDKLLSRLQILMRASGGMESDLNGQIGNEMFGETVSTSQMVVSEGLEAGVAVGAAWEIGATAVAENVQPWLGLGGKTMSDYAGVSNQATVNEVKRDALGHGAAKLAQVGAVSAADSLSSSYADSSEYGENTMDLARHATDQMQRSYDALMFQIKQLQLQYRTNCTAQ
jgi:RHS repeat-associated protein